MSVYDATFFFGYMQAVGFLIGLVYSMFFHWVGWKS